MGVPYSSEAFGSDEEVVEIIQAGAKVMQPLNSKFYF